MPLFGNSTHVSIPDVGTVTSSITVSGVYNAITDVAVTFGGLSHTYTRDLDFLLVAPDGIHNFVFLSDEGGAASGSTGVSNVSVTLSDGGNSLASSPQLVSGESYAPYDTQAETSLNWGLSDLPINHAGPAGSATFASAFGGISPNGTWTLYVRDDATGDIGGFDGWGLVINAFGVLPGTPDDDTFAGDYSSNDVINGGLGRDRVTYAGSSSGVTVNLAAGTATGDTIGSDTLISIERVTGSLYGDSVTGDANANDLDGYVGDDTIFGGAGSDLLTGGDGADTLVGNANPFVDEADTLLGGDGNDILYAERSDSVDGGSGRDVLYVVNSFDFRIDMAATSIEYVQSEFGNDYLSGRNQADRIEVYASGGNDTVAGSGLDDILYAGSGNDSVTGGNGNDVIIGDVGADRLSGEAGDDTIYFDAADTFVSGGTGRDTGYITGGSGATVDMASASFDFVQDVAGGGDAISAATGTAAVIVYAGGGNDTVLGGGGADLLWGETGADRLTGNAGDDTLVGGTGADTLTGGGGLDTIFMNGGGGGDGLEDTAIFSVGSGTDVLFDFEHNVDKLNLADYHTSLAALTITSSGGTANVFLGSTFIVSVAGNAGLLGAGDFLF